MCSTNEVTFSFILKYIVLCNTFKEHGVQGRMRLTRSTTTDSRSQTLIPPCNLHLPHAFSSSTFSHTITTLTTPPTIPLLLPSTTHHQPRQGPNPPLPRPNHMTYIPAHDPLSRITPRKHAGIVGGAGFLEQEGGSESEAGAGGRGVGWWEGEESVEGGGAGWVSLWS